MLDKIAIPVEQQDVLAALQQHYGLQGQLNAITGERDYNFRFAQSDGAQYIVKVAHEDEAYETLEFQSQVIARIKQNAPHVPVSSEIPNRSGDCITAVDFKDGPRRFMRVNAFMPGTPLCEVQRTRQTRKSIGTLTADLALALKGFRHPAEQRVLLWDIQQAAALTPHVNSLPPALRELALPFHRNFLENITPHSDQLRRGVIHNDLNLHNLFVDAHDNSRITGCIDFGDMVRAPLVNDLAIATAYQLDVQQPLKSILDVAESYNAVQPLEVPEVHHLFHLVAMRFVLTVAITHWRSRLHPENANYILRNAAAACEGLEVLSEISPATAREFLYDHLEFEANPAP